MFDVPAYKEEPYMLSKRNYVSKLSFELQEVISLRGERDTFSKTWKDVEREFKKEKDIGRQLKATGFFEDKLPSGILEVEDLEERARKVYCFIQNHYTWNGEYRIFSEVRVKSAFNEKKGNIAEINLSLINAFKAAGLDVQLALSATRDQGLVTDLYPVLTDFNYVLAHLKIGEKVFLLDATDKQMPFGMTPFKTLNGRARVMDFKKGSYWYTITAKTRNVDYYKYNLALEDDLISGTVAEVHAGYKAIEWRKKIAEEGDEVFNSESNMSDVVFSSVIFDETKFDNEKPLKISRDVSIDIFNSGEYIYFNPLMLNFDMLENPFVEENRNYPVDLGYPFAITYDLTLDIPEEYIVENIPENKILQLGQDLGICSVIYKQEVNQLKCVLRFNLFSSNFESSLYPDLQSFFAVITDEHRNAIVKIKRS